MIRADVVSTVSCGLLTRHNATVSGGETVTLTRLYWYPAQSKQFNQGLMKTICTFLWLPDGLGAHFGVEYFATAHQSSINSNRQRKSLGEMEDSS